MKKLLSLFLAVLILFSAVPLNAAYAEQPSAPLAINSTESGFITEDSGEYLYRLIVPASGRVDIEIMSYIKEVYFNMFAEDGVTEVVGADLYYGSENEPKKWVTSVDLEPGTYYLRMKKYSSYTGRYSLKTSFTPMNNNDVEPNNSVDNPQKLSFQPSSTKGYISWSDSVDVYRLDVPSAGRVDIETMSYIREVYFNVYAEDGVTEVTGVDLYYGSDSEPKKWVTSLDLEAGTYYLKVKKYSSYTGKYTLKASFTAMNNNDTESNNSVDNPQRLSFQPNALKGYISWSDDVDVYRVDMPKAGRLGLEFMSYIREVYLNVYAEDGVTEVTGTDLYYGSDSEPKKWTAGIDLEAGTYYVKIKKYSSYTGKYTLKASYTAMNNNDMEPNNSTDNPQRMDYRGSMAVGYITWSDSVDVYSFDLPRAGNVGLELTSYLNEAYIYILGSDGVTEITSSDIYYGSDKEPKKWTQILTLKPGRYFIKIKKYGSNTGKYVLRIKDTIPPAAPKVNAVLSSTKALTGTAEAYSTITAYAGSTLIGRVVAAKDGKFAIPVKPQKAGTTILIYATDASGNRSLATKIIVAK